MYVRNILSVKKTVVFIFVSFCLFSGAGLWADIPMSGYSAELTEDVIDLRATTQLRTKSGNQPGRTFTPEDLEIGDVFLTVDNEARKVVDIYEHNGKTVIETIEPRPEEVFISLYVPDFEVQCDRSNVELASLAEGVTLLPPGADKKDMLSSNFTTAAEQDKSVTWLETDPETEGMDVIAFNIDIPLWTANVSSGLVDNLKAMQDAAKSDTTTSDTTPDTPPDPDAPDPPPDTGGQDGGGDDDDFGGGLSVGASGEVRLVGTLRLAEPTISGGISMPSIKLTWVKKWWGGYPKLSFTEGYAKAGFKAAQQFDFKLTGTIQLSAELKIPLFAIKVIYSGVEALVGIYAKVGLSGQISITAEISEFTRHEVEAKCKLVWPFIPVKFSGTQSNYLNMAFRPTIAAEAELKAGLYLGGELKVVGITIAGAEAGGGAYILVGGYMEPMGIMGYDTKIGSYGNFNDWILDLYAEAGAYFEIGIEIFTIGIPLFDKKWPFWEWHKSWEL